MSTPKYYQSISLPHQNQDNCFDQPQFEVESLPPTSYHVQNDLSYNQQSQPGQSDSHQPTSSPSPKNYDECEYDCEPYSQHNNHLTLTFSTHLSQHIHRAEDTQTKLANGAQDILDLDTPKIPTFFEDENWQNGDPNSNTSHSVSSLIENWNQSSQIHYQSNMFDLDIHSFQKNQYEKLYGPNCLSSISEQQLLPLHPIPDQEYIVPGTQGPLDQSQTSSYRAFEHLPPETYTTMISNSQVHSASTQAAPPMTKSASRMSNKTRKPSTYNCTTCNKWFTSSGHLKRHFTSTMHENAVKSRGQPNPDTLPISAHHHPTRELTTREDRSSNSQIENSRGDEAYTLPYQFDQPSVLPGPLQQPLSGPYHRQPATNICPPPPLHFPMTHCSKLGNVVVNLENLNSSNISPPNGEAGLSTVNMDSIGMLSLSPNQSTTTGFNKPPPMMPFGNNQFQICLNESAPHVTQEINSLNSTGELQVITVDYTEGAQPPDAVVHNKSEITIQSKSNEIQCYECNKTFHKPAYLKQHINTSHSGRKPHKCASCGKRFASENKCKQHMKKHFGEKPHKCEICPKQFNYKIDLRRHMFLHNKNKPYTCETCKKSFIRKDHMLKHYKIHIRKAQKNVFADAKEH